MRVRAQLKQHRALVVAMVEKEDKKAVARRRSADESTERKEEEEILTHTSSNQIQGRRSEAVGTKGLNDKGTRSSVLKKHSKRVEYRDGDAMLHKDLAK